jgi:transposase InsO family protein
VIAFFSRSLAFFQTNGVVAERIVTDNGSAYRSAAFRKALGAAGVRHIRTRPYTPRTNGKAERFIQTSLREWAYAAPYETSDHRAKTMIHFIDAYNTERPHSALAFKTPWQRLNNLLGNDSWVSPPKRLSRLPPPPSPNLRGLQRRPMWRPSE